MPEEEEEQEVVPIISGFILLELEIPEKIIPIATGIKPLLLE